MTDRETARDRQTDGDTSGSYRGTEREKTQREGKAFREPVFKVSGGEEEHVRFH